ncbi:Aste57867_2627 [Aphanomyces stellatus]|uniref:Aste57867_2627 protein n=1 Tax=Aphanomyces stellatus TaxID=120398 RepID=A0A485K7Y3_9STRA|nr:hypothetical protein As57867_002620 [Aphanomyces stellatus]VFT79823.1 Aste57867_2627 [Aphanomyces stellatus]
MADVAAILRPFFDSPSETTDGSSSTSSSPLLILFFSASWCVPANDQLHVKLQTVLASPATHLPTVFFSADLDQFQFTEHIDGMTWTDVFPFNRRDDMLRIYRHFDVDTIPRVLVIDCDMKILSTDSILTHLGLPASSSPDAAHLLALLHHDDRADVVSLNTVPVDDTDEEMLHAMRQNANDMYDEGNFHGAASVFSEVLALRPSCSRSNFNLAVILHTMGLSPFDSSFMPRVGQTHLAVRYMLRVIDSDPNDATAHSVLRTVFFTLEPTLVLQGYEDIVARHPDHARAAHSLNALRGDATTSEPRYVRQVFDELSDTFEEKLVQHLHYKVPWQLLDLVKATTPLATSQGQTWRVVDLGCGTGLCGRLFKPFVHHMLGVDLSPLMVDKARELGSYDALYADELLPVLQKLPDASVDLILSADVWIYVGALELVFQAMRRVMKPATASTDGDDAASPPASYVAFSIEEFVPTESSSSSSSASEPQLEYQLVHSGRFQHSRQYIARMANDYGFRIVASDAIVVRQESLEPIPGVNYVLEAI